MFTAMSIISVYFTLTLVLLVALGVYLIWKS